MLQDSPEHAGGLITGTGATLFVGSVIVTGWVAVPVASHSSVAVNVTV